MSERLIQTATHCGLSGTGYSATRHRLARIPSGQCYTSDRVIRNCKRCSLMRKCSIAGFRCSSGCSFSWIASDRHDQPDGRSSAHGRWRVARNRSRRKSMPSQRSSARQTTCAGPRQSRAIRARWWACSIICTRARRFGPVGVAIGHALGLRNDLLQLLGPVALHPDVAATRTERKLSPRWFWK